jgi:hypothetical protein
VDHASLIYYDWGSPSILSAAQRKVPEITIILVLLCFGENYLYFWHLDSALIRLSCDESRGARPLLPGTRPSGIIVARLVGILFYS